MKYGTFQLGNRVGAFLLYEKFVIDLGQAFFRQFKRPAKFIDLGEFLESGAIERVKDLELKKLTRERTVAIPLHEVKLKAPLRRPPKIICVGLNYRAHAVEQKLEPPPAPMLFAKAPNIVIGPEDAIEIPYGLSEQIDYECELGVVIGSRARYLSKKNAMSVVGTYSTIQEALITTRPFWNSTIPSDPAKVTLVNTLNQ